jgi:ATP-dependent Lhr-like helicase
MMNSPASNSEDSPSSSFDLLHPKIQRWIWDTGWTELREAQERAIPIILEGQQDAIIAAATASGKTEAAFLPILTALLGQEERSIVLYISPLKALINDQWGRLEELCERLEIPVVPWHGDVADNRKKRFFKRPEGALLITPESLEALLMNKGHGIAGIFAPLRFIVIDELHAFIGSERGKQLQSLMHRIEAALKRRVRRIGLSATLGDMRLASEFLRSGEAVELIASRDEGQELKALIKAYVVRPLMNTAEKSHDWEEAAAAVEKPAEQAIAEHLFKTLRGANHLVFPNSRGAVETYADMLRELCEESGLPNEFWPHHGNLSKELREETEAALKAKKHPATAICTTTLELGIDIGAVKSIAQIGPAPSVASLRQRLGRSGRRKGEPAILRCYAMEQEITPEAPLADQLRARLVLTIAQIRLLLAGWCEPPRPHGLHLSTLIQQLLSALAQHGGLMASEAWRLLCAEGPFANLSQREFAGLLRSLAGQDVLMQDSRGLLLLGAFGERLISHYSFYASFATEEEFRLVQGGRTLGAIPISRPLEPGSYLIFAGRRWRVLSLDQAKKIIEVTPDHAGRAPVFNGMGGKVHGRVRQEMRQVLMERQAIPFLDPCAAELLSEARYHFQRLELGQRSVISMGDELLIFLWQGDWIQDTVTLMLQGMQIDALNEGVFVTAHGISLQDWPKIAAELVNASLRDTELAGNVLNLCQEKWDFLLPQELLVRNYASHNLDFEGARAAISLLLSEAASARVA